MYLASTRTLMTPFLLLAAVACGDGVTFPNVSAQDALSGTWVYRGNLSGDGFDCSVEGVILDLQVSGNILGGSATPGTILCSRGTLAFRFLVFDGEQPIANGSFAGNDIRFDIGSSEFHNQGIFSSDQMTGDATLVFDVPLEEPMIGTLSLAGTFEAAKVTLP